MLANLEIFFDETLIIHFLSIICIIVFEEPILLSIISTETGAIYYFVIEIDISVII